MQIDFQSLLIGFVFGWAFTTLLGIIFQRIQVAWARRGLPDRPMAVQTTITPRQVMAVAAAAFRDMLIWSIIWVAVVAVGLLALYLIWSVNK